MHLRKLILVILVSGLVTTGFAAQQRMVDAEIVIARSVDDREPVGAGEDFSSNVGQLAGWTRIAGAANTTIEHVWRYQGMENVIPLRIGQGSPWRTWSRKTIPSDWTGQWTFEARDASGNVIATTTFTVGG